MGLEYLDFTQGLDFKHMFACEYMVAILKFKMAAEDAFEKKLNQLRFCLQGYKDAKKKSLVPLV